MQLRVADLAPHFESRGLSFTDYLPYGLWAIKHVGSLPAIMAGFTGALADVKARNFTQWDADVCAVVHAVAGDLADFPFPTVTPPSPPSNDPDNPVGPLSAEDCEALHAQFASELEALGDHEQVQSVLGFLTNPAFVAFIKFVLMLAGFEA